MSRRAAVSAAAAAGVAFASDLLTKAWAQRALSGGPTLDVAGGWFRLRLGYNRGITFGMLNGGGVTVFLLTGTIILALGVWLVRSVRDRRLQPWPSAAAGAVLGGALANLIDRVPDGAVTDFLDFGVGATRWPTFNLADSFIVTGALLLALLGSSRNGEDLHG